MNIQILGLNYRSSSLSLREKVCFPSFRLPEALSQMKSYPEILEGTILSTCNRVELYAVTDDAQNGFRSMKHFLSDFHQIPLKEFLKQLYQFQDEDAIRHLFRVVCSLDSMVLGETQIFGQVKDSYFRAKEYGLVGRFLNELFHQAIRLGKMARTQTAIGKGAVSISSTAVELAKKIFKSLYRKKVLIIGAGKVGELAVKNLASRGVSLVLVANRTYLKAKRLACEFRGEAVLYEQIFDRLKDVDIVISSTSSPHLIIDKKDISSIMHLRHQRPIFFIDLGVPRNIDPEVNSLDNVYLYNIDDLARIKDSHIEERKKEAKKVEGILEKRLEFTMKRLQELKNKDG